MYHKLIKFIKIVLITLFVITLVHNLSPKVFLTNSPKIRRDILTELAKLPRNSKNLFLSLFIRKQVNIASLEKKLKDKPLLPISKGVQAKTSAYDGSITYLDFKNMELEVFWITTKKGNKTPIMVPKGQQPSQTLIDQIVNNY